MRCNDLSGGDFKRRKQRRRAVTLVVVALAGQGAAVGQLQIALRSLQSLDRGLFVNAKHDGPLGRGDIEANDIGGFGRKVRIVTLTPGLASHEVNLAVAQETPDILDIDIAQRLGQQRAGPAREPRLAAACPAASESGYRWPSCRSVACQAAACPAALQGHGRHSGAAKG